MALTSESRAAIYDGLSELIRKDAVEEMLTNFPARDLDEPASKDYLDARLSALELRLTNTWQAQIGELRRETNARFDSVDSKFDGVNTRFDGVNAKFDGVNTRFDGINAKFEAINALLSEANAKTDRLEATMEKRFASQTRWMVSMLILVPTIIATIQSVAS